MMERQKNRYRGLLKVKEKELLAALQRREGIAIQERIPDTMDEVLSSNDRDFAICALDRVATLLREVRAALDSLEDGAYGICTTCERRIPHRRLEAVPWTCMCVICQETADRTRQEEENFDGLGALHPAA